jgi:hypothetical protein
VTAPRNPLEARPAVVGEPGLNLALSRIGLPAAAAAQNDLVLRRREWLLDVMEAQRALSAKAQAIPRVRGLSPEDFLDSYYAPGRPVVIERAIGHWLALKRWTPDYLRRKIGDAPVEFQGGRNANPDFEIDGYSHKQKLPFGAYLDLIAAGGNDSYITANNSVANRAALAPLERDLGTIDSYLTRAHGMIWIGPVGTFTPLHFDLTNNLIAQIIGRKRVILLPPSEAARLHHGRHVFSAVRDLEDEERLSLYPSAREARRFVVDLGPGDLLYSPIGWWHQVRAHAFSVTITYTNFRWPNRGFDSYPAD